MVILRPTSNPAHKLTHITGGFGGSCELSYIPLLHFHPNYFLMLTLDLLFPLGFLVETPYHFELVDFCDPFRPDIPPDLLAKLYEQDLLLRSNLRGKIENMILGARGTPEVYGWLSQLLWDHLYQIPANFPY